MTRAASIPCSRRISVAAVCRNWFGCQRRSLCHLASAARSSSVNRALHFRADSFGRWASAPCGGNARSHAR